MLNPDTELVGDTLAALLRYARPTREAGLVGGRTLSPDGELDPGSCWGAQSLWSLVCFASGLSTVFRGSRSSIPSRWAAGARDSAREVDIVTGCLCLSPRTVWEQLGGFDETFFMYGEDADLAARARKARLPPGDHARRRDRAPRRRVLALGREARDDAALSRGARAQALVAQRAATAVVAAAGRDRACARWARPSTRRSGSTWPAVWRRRRDWRGGYA